MKPLDLPAAWGVSRETLDKLRAYHALLLKWQNKINLISPNTVADAWERHFVDSAQIAPLVPSAAKALYDLGSGAGFPGMVLAIMRPDLSVTLIESDSKKCAFLQTVSRETGAPVTVLCSRIETASAGQPAPDIITARALSSLAALLDYCRPWLKTEGLQFLFPKGRQFQMELNEAKAAGWLFDIETQKSITDSEGRILRLMNVESS